MISERKARAMVGQGDVQVRPLRIELIEIEPRTPDARTIDWSLDVSWGQKTCRYAVEYVSVGTPRNLEFARERIARALRSTPGMLPMVMTPYLSEDKLNELAEREVSGIDLCGNGVVIAPGDWFVYRTGRPNRFPTKAAIKNIYAGTSSLVCRALLTAGRFERLSDIPRAIEAAGGQISLGTVSKVVRCLEDELLVSKEDGIRLIQPLALLDRVANSYQPREPVSRLRGSFPDGKDLLQRASAWARDTGAGLAVSGAGRYAQAPSSDAYPPIYTDRPTELARELHFEPADRFASAEIRGTEDPLPYFDAQRVDGVTWQSPLQTYLEMMQGGKRERELAATLREQVLGGSS